MKKRKEVLCCLVMATSILVFSSYANNVILKPAKILKSSIVSENSLKKQGIFKNNWRLVWSDEFDDVNGDGSLNKKKWNYEVGFIRNKESQYYTNDRRDNVRVKNGKLIIEAKKEAFTDKKNTKRKNSYKGNKAQYTSGSINTLKKFSFKYGRIDVRAKLPGGRGAWPAIWMMGIDRSHVKWPKCGEIDIMEYVVNGKDNNEKRIYSTVHGPNYNWKAKNEPRTGNILFNKSPTVDYHVYSLEWDKNGMTFFFDGKRYLVIKKTKNVKWVYDKQYYILLNLALGGSWGGKINDNDFPKKYYVDYVRVYSKIKK